MTHSPRRASPARANLHRLDEPMNPMTSDTLGVEELAAIIDPVAMARDANGVLIPPAFVGNLLDRRRRSALSKADAILALLPKGVDGGGREEEQEVSSSQSQPGYDASRGASAHAEPSAACECVKLFDEKLADYNHQVVTTLFGQPARVAIATTKLRHDVRAKRPPVVLASYCPFCGFKYAKDPS